MRSAFTDGWWVWGCEVRLCDPCARVSRVCPGSRRCFFLIRLRPPRCVSTGPVVVRLAGMANEREREREFSRFLNQ